MTTGLLAKDELSKECQNRIAALVKAAPPLSPGQRARLAALLS